MTATPGRSPASWASAYLLDGSVQRAGDRVRVATNLTNGRTGFSEWSQRVDRKLDDIFAFQSEIARNVSNALSVRMATDAPAPGGTRNAKAYEAYLRGKALYNLAKDEAIGPRGARQFRSRDRGRSRTSPWPMPRCRESSPRSPRSNAQASELKPLYSAAVAEAQRAIDLAPTLPEGHLALGYANFAGFLDVRGARPSYDKAYEYGRGDADIVLLCALYAVRARRFAEARDAIERALALDPLNPRTHRAAGIDRFCVAALCGRGRAPIAAALELNPEISNAHAVSWAISSDAVGQARRGPDGLSRGKRATMFRLTGLAILEHRAGNKAAAEQGASTHWSAEVGDAAHVPAGRSDGAMGQGATEAMAMLSEARAVGDFGPDRRLRPTRCSTRSRVTRLCRAGQGLGFA